MLGEGAVLLILWSFYIKDSRKGKHMIATVNSINSVWTLALSAGEVIGSLAPFQGSRSA
jgi:hypothetical protein